MGLPLSKRPTSAPQFPSGTAAWQRALETEAVGWEQRFNQPPGMFPYALRTVVDLYGEEGTRAQMPYWEIPADDPALEIMGQPPGAGEGRVPLFVHPRDTDALERMVSARGPADGFVEMMPRASKRSVLVTQPPPDAPDVFEVKTGFIKGLRAEDVRLAVSQTQAHPGDAHLVDEPAGVAFHPDEGPPVSNLFRSSGLEKVTPAPGSHLVPITAFLSSEWRDTEGRRALGFRSDEDARSWLVNQFAPALAEFMVDSLLVRASHFEMHGQNLLAYVHPDDGVHLLVRDLQDCREDAELRAVLQGKNAASRTEVLTKDATAPLNERTLVEWYGRHLPLLRDGIQGSFDVATRQAFDSAIAEGVLKLGTERLASMVGSTETVRASLDQHLGALGADAPLRLGTALTSLRRAALELLSARG